jgi:hypothetical protein
MSYRHENRILHLDYRPPRADATQRRHAHPNKLIGRCMIFLSIVGACLLISCLVQPLNLTDRNADFLGTAFAGLFLVMLVIPGVGLAFAKPPSPREKYHESFASKKRR